MIVNKTCACVTLNSEAVTGHLDAIIKARPNLFSSTSAFISENDFKQISTFIATTERVINSPSFRKRVLKEGLKDRGTKGAFMGYDFHMTEEGPKLIEINTNAGGAFVNVSLALAQERCCQEVKVFKESRARLEGLGDKFYQMFLTEWRYQRGQEPLSTIAIVDENPPEQFLYPEFLLAKNMLEEKNLEVFILDPSELTLKETGLWWKNKKIDLIYDRLTDFYLEGPELINLKTAYEEGLVVLTPAPFHHALYADKKNLTLLSSEESLRELGVPAEDREVILQVTPEAVPLTPLLWEERKMFFFKPVKGFGSKAIYRGDKITKKVWESILKQDYIAQRIITPSERVVLVDGKETELKMDVRAYVYEGEVQLLAARLYSGQTTNFRTQGGGFAPVFIF